VTAEPSPPPRTAPAAARRARHRRWRRAAIAAALAVTAAGFFLAWVVFAVPPLASPTSGEQQARLLETPMRSLAQRLSVHPTAPWPLWGATPARTRFVPSRLQPPFELLYRVPGRALVEMPPVIAEGRLVFGTHAGTVRAARTSDGSLAWVTDLRGCIASSAAAGPGTVYIGWAGPAPCRRGKDATGGLAALDLATGRVLWRFRPGNVESSPLVLRDLLFFAAYRSRSDSTVYALKLHPRRVLWSYHLPTKVASSPALIGRTLFVAAYDRRLYSFDAFTGRLRWRSSALPQHGAGRMLLALRSLIKHASLTEAGYYATPTIAYGRAYIGSIDGVFSAFSAVTGRHRWSRYLGGAIYGSAAVWNDTVYVGSSSGAFVALDAGTGAERWRRGLPGRILGSPTVTNGLVYVSTLDRQTFALDAHDGTVVWHFDDGQYSPLVLDGRRAFIVGKGRIYAVVNAQRRGWGATDRRTFDGYSLLGSAE
jgi:outer membrane protein assembly factor BamB